MARTENRCALDDADGNYLVFDHLKKDRAARTAVFFEEGGIKMPKASVAKKADAGSLTLFEALINYNKAFPDRHCEGIDFLTSFDSFTRDIDDLLYYENWDEESDTAIPNNEEEQAAIDALAAVVGDYHATPGWTHERLIDTLRLMTEKGFKQVLGNRGGRNAWEVHRNNVGCRSVGRIPQWQAIIYRDLLMKTGLIYVPQGDTTMPPLPEPKTKSCPSRI
jgi:hypothetical protein